MKHYVVSLNKIHFILYLVLNQPRKREKRSNTVKKVDWDVKQKYKKKYPHQAGELQWKPDYVSDDSFGQIIYTIQKSGFLEKYRLKS